MRDSEPLDGEAREEWPSAGPTGPSGCASCLPGVSTQHRGTKREPRHVSELREIGSTTSERKPTLARVLQPLSAAFLAVSRARRLSFSTR
jgi:hypothetical protein